MQDRPTAAELLATVAELLEQQLLPATQGPLRHPVRVAGNLCRILEREMDLGGAQEAREVAGLQALLESEETDPLELNRALAARLASGDDPDFERRARELLLDIVRGKLAIAKPGYDDYDFRDERPS